MCLCNEFLPVRSGPRPSCVPICTQFSQYDILYILPLSSNKYLAHHWHLHNRIIGIWSLLGWCCLHVLLLLVKTIRYARFGFFFLYLTNKFVNIDSLENDEKCLEHKTKLYAHTFAHTDDKKRNTNFAKCQKKKTINETKQKNV